MLPANLKYLPAIQQFHPQKWKNLPSYCAFFVFCPRVQAFLRSKVWNPYFISRNDLDQITFTRKCNNFCELFGVEAVAVVVDLVLSTLGMIYSFRYIEQRSYRHFPQLLSVVLVDTQHCLLGRQTKELVHWIGRGDFLHLLYKIRHPKLLNWAFPWPLPTSCSSIIIVKLHQQLGLNTWGSFLCIKPQVRFRKAGENCPNIQEI